MSGVTTFSQAIADEVCERIVEGESSRQICRDTHMPSTSTLFKWLADQPTFSEQYARAKEIQLERMADELLEISDDGTNDWMEREKEAGRIETVPDHEHINRSRLRVDSRKWLLSKLVPKRYGDKQTLEHTGPDGGAIQVAMDQEKLKSFILAVTHDCPTCRTRAAEKLLEMEGNPGGD